MRFPLKEGGVCSTRQLDAERCQLSRLAADFALLRDAWNRRGEFGLQVAFAVKPFVEAAQLRDSFAKDSRADSLNFENVLLAFQVCAVVRGEILFQVVNVIDVAAIGPGDEVVKLVVGDDHLLEAVAGLHQVVNVLFDKFVEGKVIADCHRKRSFE